MGKCGSLEERNTPARPRGGIAVLALLLVSLGSLSAAADSVRVIKAKPEVSEKYFDPRNRPKEMPELHGSEQAVCQSKFGIVSEFQVAILDEQRAPGKVTSRVRIVSATIRLTLQSTQWLPNGAGEAIKEHESAHSRIALMHYDTADEVAEKLARKHIGQIVSGEGDTVNAARQEAIAKANKELCAQWLATVERPSARVNDLFDEITSHGRRKIDVETAIKRAFDGYAKETEKK